MSKGKTMRVILVSSDEHGQRALGVLYGIPEVDVIAIFTVRDEMIPNTCGYSNFAEIIKSQGTPVYKVRNINSEENIQLLQNLSPDFIFVVGWSQILSKEILDIPKQGCIGYHPTELPKHRGRAPIPWSIIHDLRQSAVTLFYLDEGVDSGDVLAQRSFSIDFKDTATTMFHKIGNIITELVAEVVPLLVEGRAPRQRQDNARATYWPKRVPEDGLIDWNQSAYALYNWIRALTHPYPGAFTYYQDKKLTIWKAFLADLAEKGTPGMIVGSFDSGVKITAGEGGLILEDFELETPEGGTLTIENFRPKSGEILG